MAVFLTFRTIYHLAFLFLAAFAGMIGVFEIGVRAVGDNPGAVDGGIPFFAATYLFCLGLEFVWMERRYIFHKATWRDFRTLLFLFGTAFFEFSISVLEIAVGLFLAIFASLQPPLNNSPVALSLILGVSFMVIDLGGGALLYLWRTKRDHPLTLPSNRL